MFELRHRFRLLLPFVLFGCASPVPPANPPLAESLEDYYIMVDTSSLSAWGTAQMTRDAWQMYSPSSPWLQDAPDNYLAVESVFVRSPTAATDGPTTRQVVDGVEFEHIVDVLELPAAIDPEGLLSRTVILKYQEVVYPGPARVAAGENWLRLLVDPEGRDYVLINRDPSRVEDAGALPVGWSHEHLELTEDRTVVLSGRLESITDSIGDLYQGPVDVR